MGYQINILDKTESNQFFREVLFSSDKSQLVVMNIEQGGEVGEEMHAKVEQILFNHSGSGKVVLDGVETSFEKGDVVVVPPGVTHNFINIGDTALKIYTVYVPANHPDGTIHQTKEDAENDSTDEEFSTNVNS